MSDVGEFLNDDSLDMEVDSDDVLSSGSVSSLSTDSTEHRFIYNSDTDDEAVAERIQILSRLRSRQRRVRIIIPPSGSEIDSVSTESLASDQESDEIETEPVHILRAEESQESLQSTINEHDTESVDTQELTGSGSIQQPTESGSMQQPTGSGSTQQPTGSGSTQQPTGSGSIQQPTGSENILDSAGSAVVQESAESEMVQQPLGSQENPTAVISNDDNINVCSADEAFSCPICLESLTNTGIHRPACLKCGHIFGEQCIDKWIRVGCNRDARRCPTCNTKACVRDIRILYAKSLCAVDTAELTAVQCKLEKKIREKNLMKAEMEGIKVRNELLNEEVNKLKTYINEARCGQPSASPSPRQCIKTITISKNPSCRVMAFNKNNMMLAVSQSTGSVIFNTSHVIRKVNTSILELSKECIYAHAKPIRDMAFHPVGHNLLASVSLDKCIKLSDMISNTIVASVVVDEPLWSCCWSGDDTNMLIVGGQGGALYYLDQRYMELKHTAWRRTPSCVSLVPLPPSPFRAFDKGGFLKTRMDILTVYEYDEFAEESPNGYKEIDLPLKGLWSNSSFDSQSNLILSTSKPCGPNKSIRHIVSKLGINNEHAIEPVATFFGGDKATQLSRSCIVPSTTSDTDILVTSYDEKTSAIKLFSVNELTNIHNFPVKESFLDLCHLDGVVIKGRRTLAALSEGSVSIFSV